MGRCSIITLLVAVLALPALARADVPGGPPAVPPDCPPGTTLEGPYRYWRCVPVAPSDPSVPAVGDPAPAPTPPPVAPAPPPVEVQAAPPAQTPAGAATSGCAVGSGSSAGSAWMLVALVAARRWRRRNARSAQRHSGGTA